MAQGEEDAFNLLLALNSCSWFCTFSSCVFKEQDLAAREAVECNDGNRKERKLIVN